MDRFTHECSTKCSMDPWEWCGFYPITGDYNWERLSPEDEIRIRNAIRAQNKIVKER